MIESDNERAGQLFIELFDSLTKPFKSSFKSSAFASPVKIYNEHNSMIQQVLDEKKDETEYYNEVERLQEIQENHYLMYINAENDEDAEKHHDLYRKVSEQLHNFIYR